ncbi:cobalamin-dependent protein [candidate division KSB1 bacterium]|nr:cobalamin-dependent protein [candidate division KSB1 bacterium]
MQEISEKIAMCVERGKISKTSPFPPDMKDQDGADEIAAQALKDGLQPDALLNGCMLGMERIGKKFSENKVFVPELLMAAKAMTAVMNHLKPFLESGAVKQKGKFVIGTVSGDLHDIGKNLVSMTVKGGGYDVIDLGVDVSSQKFLDAVANHPGCFVGLSALLTTTMINMEKSVKAIKEAHPDTRILIGGAPVTQDFCQKVGADYYSPTPQGAVEYLNKCVA